MKVHKYYNFIIRFFKSLDDKLFVIRSQVLLLDPLPLVNRVFALVIQHEGQLQATNALLDDL
ncbi:hypothetical protein AHAS_Ahas02G0032800 [Arachis hypogaea]